MTTRILPAILATAVALGLAACGSDKPAGAEPAAPPPAPPVTDTQITTETPESPAVEILVEGGKPKGGEKTITVKQGDTVRIRVEVDEPQEIHVHGYELEQEATPEAPAVFEFAAEIEGIFDIETHLADAKIGKLVVEP